jgi:hypothetical protein
LLGGAGSFTLAIVGRLAVLSPLWLIGLVAACEVFRLLNPVRQRQMVSRLFSVLIVAKRREQPSHHRSNNQDNKLSAECRRQAFMSIRPK